MIDKKIKKLYMIGNSHIDIVWLWKDEEGFQEVKSTFMSVLERMDEFPEFIFSASSISFYRWIEDNFPDIFIKIKKKIEEGKWEVVGGWFIEPDCNIPSGESFVRHALYSQWYLKEKFNKIATVGFSVDSFGHNGSLPQILKKSGLDSYFFMRPHKELLNLPSMMFKWESMDGSHVMGVRLEGEYTAWTKNSIRRNINNTLIEMDKSDLSEMICFYGVGNHGGGPTIDNIKSIKELKESEEDLIIEFSKLEDFVINNKDVDMPVYRGELQRIFDGCFSVDSELKALNRKSEYLALKCEKLWTMANILKVNNYPKEDIEKMWELILFNQFHDILAGTSRFEARNEAAYDFHGAISLGRKLLILAKESIAMKIDTRGHGFPLIIYNANSYDVDEMIEVDIYWRENKDLRIKDNCGIDVFYEEVSYENTINSTRKRIIFKASVPSMGYAVYRLIQEKQSLKGQIMKISDLTLENSKIKAKFNKDSGSIESIFDKLNNYESLNGQIAFKIYKDERDTWGAEGRSDEFVDSFKLISIKPLMEGANRSAIISLFKSENSTLEVIYYLDKDSDFLLCKNRLFSDEKLKLIKLSIPVNVNIPQVRSEVQYGFIDRQFLNNEECFALSYMDINESNKGLAIATDGKYAYRMKNNEYELTISRSSIYSFGSSDKIEENKIYRYIDKGEQEFKIAIKPHGKAIDNAYLIKLSNSVNSCLEYLADNNHLGWNCQREMSFLSVDKENVIVSVLKISEDNNSYIVRLYETEGSYVNCILMFGKKTIELSFKPCEIKTISIDILKSEVKEVNLIEMDMVD